MSQHDFNIANATLPAFRTDLNNALAAAASTSAGSTAPSTTREGQLWVDTSENKLKIRNEADTGWITLFSFSDDGQVSLGDEDSRPVPAPAPTPSPSPSPSPAPSPTPPPPTSLAAPRVTASAAVIGTGVTLTWSAVSGALWYEYRYRRTSSSIWSSWTRASGVLRRVDVTGLAVNTQYTLQVRAYRGRAGSVTVRTSSTKGK